MKKTLLLFAVLLLSITSYAQDKVRLNLTAESNTSFEKYQLDFDADVSKWVSFKSVINHTTKGNLFAENKALTYDNLLVIGLKDINFSSGIRYYEDFTNKQKVLYVVYKLSIKIF